MIVLTGLPIKKCCTRRGRPGACVLRQHEAQAQHCADCGGPLAEFPIFDGNYALLRDLGEGSYGTVHKALDLTEERPLALKVLRDLSPDDQRRFIEEAKVTRRLRHPNIVEVYQGCRRAATGQLYIAMEHLEGETVQQALTRGAMGWARARPLFLQMLSAMAVAHQQQIVHRDLKPSNLFLCVDPEGHEVLKVLDFGIAKVQEAVGATRASHVLGTPKYLAPDQLLPDARPNAGRDVYAMGLILIEMLGLQPPTLVQRIKDAPHAGTLAQECPGLASLLPAPVYAVLQRSLAADPQQRYRDANAVLAALEAPPEEEAAPRRSLAALIGGAALALAVVVMLVALRAGRAPQPEALLHQPDLAAPMDQAVSDMTARVAPAMPEMPGGAKEPGVRTAQQSRTNRGNATTKPSAAKKPEAIALPKKEQPAAVQEKKTKHTDRQKTVIDALLGN